MVSGALAAIAIAGAAIYATVADDVTEYLRQRALRRQAEAREAAARANPAPPPPPRDPRDPGEIRTRLLVLRGKNGGSVPVVALARPVGPKSVDIVAWAKQTTLDRELVRQALLIAARDELGLPTRDEVLDDLAPDDGAGEPVELASVFRGNGLWATIRRGPPEKAEDLARIELPDHPERATFSGRLAARLEAGSRSEFIEALKRLGLEGARNKVRDDAPVPPDVDRQLEGLGLVDHFAAVRALHDAIRADGESPARLSALSRAYAQLGALTEYQWSPAHRAFKARAMLYAERLVARAPRSANAFWSRAFVRALVGYHAEALADLSQAGELAAAEKPPSPTPSWVPVIEAHARCDLRRLEVKDGPHARLAALLRMFQNEYPERTRAAVLAAREVVTLDVDCYRAYDVLCNSGQLDDLHRMTLIGPEAFTRLLPVKLKSLKSLPTPVRQVLDKGFDELKTVEALDRAGRPGVDSGEPSWAVLAHLEREVRFVQVWRRIKFMTCTWSVPADDYWADVQPFVARHRYAPFVESMVLPPPQARAAMERLAKDFDPTDLEVSQLDLYQRFEALKVPVPEKMWGFHTSHCESGAGDFSQIVSRSGKGGMRLSACRRLLELSPCCAYAMAALIQDDWERVRDDVPAWLERAGNAPALIGALGKKYAELKQYDEAEKYLRRYVESSPDRSAYETLAGCYKARGDRDRWKATLDDYLANTENAGLEHATVQVEIADELMKDGRWAEAKEYAEPAAETWAGWAMMCAARCNEGLGDWGRAELWIQRTTERYPGTTWPDWYLFCKRTGHGDVEAARQYVEEYLAAAGDRTDLAHPEVAGYFYWSAGSMEKAHQQFGRAYAASPTSSCGNALALTADRLGDTARRDKVLDETCARFKEQAPRTTAIWSLIRDSLADGGRRPLDLAAVDKELAAIPAEFRGNTEFIVGQFLVNRGRLEEARKYLRPCADSPDTYVWLKIIAAETLRSPGRGKAR